MYKLFSLLALLEIFFYVFIPLMYAQDKEQQRLPVIYNLGIIPLRIENISKHDNVDILNEKISLIENAYYESFKKSSRFNVINDDLVNISWENQKGRDDLIVNHRLHAFVSLSLVFKGKDDIMLSLKLLNPYLKIYLIEEETLSGGWILASSKSEINEKVENLVYRLINRIPLDCFIFSIQGKYVTLSCGRANFISVGESFDVMKAYISFTHPVSGAWINYKIEPVGKIKIIEIKERSSIGEIITLNKMYGIDLSDGFKNPRLPSRVKFEVYAKEDRLKSVNSDNVEVVYPLYEEPKIQQQIVSQEDKIKSANPPSPPSVALATPNVQIENQKQSLESNTLDNSYDDTTYSKEKDSAFFVLVSSYIKNNFDYVNMRAGHVVWSIRGAGSARSVVSPWLINDIGLSLYKKSNDKISYKLGSDLGFGFTKDGSFLSLMFEAQLYYLILSQDGVNYFAGPVGNLSTTGVYSEQYGGSDFIKFGFFVARQDIVKLNPRQTINLLSELFITPLGLGQIGANGKTTSVNSIFEWKLKESLFIEELKFKNFNLGAELLFLHSKFKASSSVTYNQFAFFITALQKF